MSSTSNIPSASSTPRADVHVDHRDYDDHARYSETRPAMKTTEFMAYVAAVLVTVVTAFVVNDDGENTADPFSAEHAIRYITFLTIGYMVARGLAKAGTRSPGHDDRDRTARR
jgi:hypothetical protein